MHQLGEMLKLDEDQFLELKVCEFINPTDSELLQDQQAKVTAITARHFDIKKVGRVQFRALDMAIEDVCLLHFPFS